MDLILTNGYNRVSCSSPICPLAVGRIGPLSIAAPTTNRPTTLPAKTPVAPTPQTAPLQYTNSGAVASAVSSWKLTKLGTNAKSVSVGSDGSLGMTDISSNIWMSTIGGPWTQIPGTGVYDIAVIDKSHFFVVSSNRNIWRWSGSGWDKILGNTTSISASADGTVAAVSSQNGQIWVRDGYNDDKLKWVAVPFVLGATRATLVKNGWLYYIGSDGRFYYTDMVSKPVKMDGMGVEISAGAADGSLVTCNAVFHHIWSHYTEEKTLDRGIEFRARPRM